MRDKIKGKPPLDLYQAVREIACRLDDVIDYLNNNDPAFSNMYVRTFNGQTGDVVGVSSVNGQTGDVTVQGGGAVDSVNGKTGDVTLTGNDISLSAAGGQSISGVIDTLYGADNPPPYPVTSVNTKTGAVELKGSNISVSDDNDENIAAELAKKYDASNPPPYPVTSVNGQTGDVEISTGGGAVESVNGKTGAVLLTAADINATAGGTVQQNINTFSSDIEELGNEVNTLQQGVSNLETEVDGKYSASNPPPYPVTSVNGATGAVSLNSIIDNSNNARTQATGGSNTAGLIFGSLNSIYGYLMFNSSYDLTIRSNTNQYLGQVYTTLDPPPAKLPTASVSISSGTANIPANTLVTITGLRFPLEGTLPTGNTTIIRFTSPNLANIQPLNASASSGYLQTNLSRGANYLYLTVTNNIPGEPYSGYFVLYLYSTVATTLNVVNN